ncbi:MAG: hypothetical protein IJR15_07515 [Clostridiales bacterium]|nr:hypothetical protein [Clostridiales bacterium]
MLEYLPEGIQEEVKIPAGRMPLPDEVELIKIGVGAVWCAVTLSLKDLK